MCSNFKYFCCFQRKRTFESVICLHILYLCSASIVRLIFLLMFCKYCQVDISIHVLQALSGYRICRVRFQIFKFYKLQLSRRKPLLLHGYNRHTLACTRSNPQSPPPPPKHMFVSSHKVVKRLVRKQKHQ